MIAAEDGHDAWLRYARLSESDAARYNSFPSLSVVIGDSPVLATAQKELLTGIKSMLGRGLRVASDSRTSTIVLQGTVDGLQKHDPAFHVKSPLPPDAYSLVWSAFRGSRALVIAGGNDRAVLYGTFDLLRRIAQGQDISRLAITERPSAPVRWVNQWDNLDGSIERGYAGRSIFFEDGKVRQDLTRVAAYARLLSSVGINGCNVSNVNADVHILDPSFIPQLARIAEAFRPYGIRLGVAVNVSMPKEAGGLDSFDPLDSSVADWWKAKFSEVYRQIPDFGGVVVKADSEGQLGPSVYGRLPTDAANVIAKALRPHGGVVFYRAFVYNHHLDWNDPKADRARAAYDIFHPLDGGFADNVIVQIKNGPIDFQVREPASPLFGGLRKTNEAVELQITQEYTGQQRHTVFLVPMWKEVLDFDMQVEGRHTPVKEIVSGHSFHCPIGGYVGVANVGSSTDWLANHLALANLYGFGRLAWNPNLSSRQIAEEWTRLTFGNNPEVIGAVSTIQLSSWPAYEHYTGVFGLQTLTNITGPHYGPAPESQERNGWGQWIRAGHDGVGMDRTIATGTGFIGQYSLGVQKIFEHASDTPDELLLFFHHVPYTYKLHSGKTVIQSIYDLHYAGAAKANEFVTAWQTLKGKIDDERYEAVLEQLEYQAGHAIVWRDAINDWFRRISGIDDQQSRVGRHRHRIEAEEMAAKGYEPFVPESWEGASGGKAMKCVEKKNPCDLETRFAGTTGDYEIDVEYFDLSTGQARFRILVNEKVIDSWLANLSLPGKAPSADSSVRRRVKGVRLRAGDVIRLEGVPDAGDRAAVDYIEIIPISQH